MTSSGSRERGEGREGREGGEREKGRKKKAFFPFHTESRSAFSEGEKKKRGGGGALFLYFAIPLQDPGI